MQPPNAVASSTDESSISSSTIRPIPHRQRTQTSTTFESGTITLHATSASGSGTVPTEETSGGGVADSRTSPGKDAKLSMVRSSAPPKTEDDWCDLLADYVSQSLLTRSKYFQNDYYPSSSSRPSSSSLPASRKRTQTNPLLSSTSAQLSSGQNDPSQTQPSSSRLPSTFNAKDKKERLGTGSRTGKGGGEFELDYLPGQTITSGVMAGIPDRIKPRSDSQYVATPRSAMMGLEGGAKESTTSGTRRRRGSGGNRNILADESVEIGDGLGALRMDVDERGMIGGSGGIGIERKQSSSNAMNASSSSTARQLSTGGTMERGLTNQKTERPSPKSVSRKDQLSRPDGMIGAGTLSLSTREGDDEPSSSTPTIRTDIPPQPSIIPEEEETRRNSSGDAFIQANVEGALAVAREAAGRSASTPSSPRSTASDSSPSPDSDRNQDPEIPDVTSHQLEGQSMGEGYLNLKTRGGGGGGRGRDVNAENSKSRQNLARRLGQGQRQGSDPLQDKGENQEIDLGDTPAMRDDGGSTTRGGAGGGSLLNTGTTIRSPEPETPMPNTNLGNPFDPPRTEERPSIEPIQHGMAPVEDKGKPSGLDSPDSTPNLPLSKDFAIDADPLDGSRKARKPSEAETNAQYRTERLDRHRAQAKFIKEFFDERGFMPAPQQSPETKRRQLRTIRRLGLDNEGEEARRTTLDRFTRLACSVFKAKMATVTIIGQNSQLFASEVGLNTRTMELELGFCTHTSLSERQVMVVPDAAEDWRFRNHPMVKQGDGPIRFYAGAPLTFGEGEKSCTIGTFCVIDDKPRMDWSAHDSAVLVDLAGCVLGDLELMFEERQKELRSVMHQVTVDFLRQSLRGPAPRRQIRERDKTSSVEGESAALESFGKSADARRSEGSGAAASATRATSLTAPESTMMNRAEQKALDLYQEACNVILHTLNAHAVAIVDLSRFHIYFPSLGNEEAGTERGTGTSTTGATNSAATRSTTNTRSVFGGSSEAYSWNTSSSDPNRARALHGHEGNPRIPIVEFVRKTKKMADFIDPEESEQEKVLDFDPINVLGQSYSGSELQFNFNTTAGHKTIAHFIVQHLATRRVWYERNDGPLIASSLTSIMPKGTEVSLTLPVFDFQGQAAFCVAVCWSDPLYTYDKAAIGFVENISGSLLANTLRTRLSSMEQSQRAFAAFASHQWRTPLHQMMTTTALMRQFIALTPPPTPAPTSEPMAEYFQREQDARQARTVQKNQELALMLDTLESSGRSLQDTLGDILDFLDVGTDSQYKQYDGGTMFSEGEGLDMDKLMSDAILEAQATEILARSASGRDLRRLETILEVVPRTTGDWVVLRDFGPLKRACYKIISNSYAATSNGFVSVIVEDVSHRATIPQGYDRSLPKSIIRITVEDTGIGMSPQFAESEIFRPFTKADKFSPGSGLGCTLTQRILILMGGTIRYTSVEGKGTTAVIEVPLYIQDRTDEECSAPTPGDGLPPIAVLGFDGQSDEGLTKVNESLRRQLRAAGCIVTNHTHEASIFVCEEDFDLLAAHPDILERSSSDVKVVIICPATSLRKDSEDNPTKLGGSDIGVTWIFRPLMPSVVEKIIAVGRTSSMKDEIDKEQILPSPTLQGQSLSSPVELLSLNHDVPHRDVEAPIPSLTDEAKMRTTDEGAITQLPPMESPAIAPASDRSRRNSADQPSFRVLVVEDNPINRRLLVGMIKRMDIICFEAVDGEEAVTKYVESRPSLVLLDINMPKKDGFSAAADIRSHEKSSQWSRCKIIAVTALSGERDKRKGMIESGIDDWVTKPVGIQNLRSSIEALRATRGKVDEEDRREMLAAGEENQEAGN